MNLRKWLLGILLIGALFFGGTLSTGLAHFHSHSIAGSKGGGTNVRIAGSKGGGTNVRIAGGRGGVNGNS